ncbi:MAG: xylose isomerase [Clostridiales bacterium]|nr:MAG: xylose isomerase [Clostridiales bacterium]
MSKFIISGFADEIDPYLNTQMDVLDPLGIRYIEIRRADAKNISVVTEAEAEEMSARLTARGYKISAIGSPIGKIKVTDDFEPHVELFKNCIRMAQIFGAPYIRMFSFYPPEGEDVAKYRDVVMKRWETFLKIAEGTGVTLLHENEKDIYGDVAERCLDLAETLGIGLIFDPANFIQSGVTTYPDAFELLKKHIRYMHVKDALMENGQVRPAGYGDAGLDKILSGLDKMGFEGFLSLEPHLGSFQGFAELEPASKTNMMAEGGPKSYNIAAESLFKLLGRLGIEPAQA